MTITKHFFKLLYSVIIISSLLIYNSCEKSDKPFEPPPPIPIKDTITVSIESVSHRSISININKKLNLKGDTYQLNRVYQDDVETVFNYSITGEDTVIVDDNQGEGLELKTTYGYKVFRLDSLNVQKDSSNTVYATTLSATSHDYTWEVITIGEWQSALYDVWGTDENNVYAVGAVRIEGKYYGILKWDGNEWKAELSRGGRIAIFGFSENDIWEAGLNHVTRFDGNEWKRIDGYTIDNQDYPLDEVLFENSPYTSIWGTSRGNLYFTGLEGKIVHWDGVKGTVIETPTMIDLTDIYGLSNDFILTTGSGSTYPSIAMIFNGQYWDILENLHYEYELYKSIYPISRTEYYLGGSVSYHYFGKIWNQLLIGSEGMIRKIRGDDATGDIVAVGGITALYHYNGEDWYNFSPELENERVILHGVYVKNGTIFAVGTDGTNAKIFIGRRN